MSVALPGRIRDGSPAERVPATLAAVVGCPLLAFAAQSMPAVALPTLGADFGAGFGPLQWVLAAYVAVFAALLLPAGALADAVGHRAVFAAGAAVFALGSLGCALAPGPWPLVGARALQGVGAAALMGVSLGLLADGFSGQERNRALGAWGAAIGGGIALGPLLGGAAIGVGSWRAFFAATAVAAALLALVVTRALPARAVRRARRFDALGAALMAAGVGAVTAALIQGNAWGWTAPATLATATAGATTLGVLAVGQLHGRRSLLDGWLVRDPAARAGLLCSALLGASFLGVMIQLGPVFLQTLGTSALGGAALYLPWSATSFAVSLVGGRLLRTHSARALLALGLALCTASLLLLSRLTVTTGPWALALPLLVGGLGFGLVNPAVGAAGIARAPAAHVGLAGGASTAARQCGQALGIAGLGALLQQAGAHVAGRAPALGPAVLDRVRQGDLPGALSAAPAGSRDAVQRIFEEGQARGVHTIALVAAAVAALAALAALVTMPRA